MAITEPGLYEIDEADYHADPCIDASLSQSIAKIIIAADGCPRKAWYAHPRLNADFAPEHDQKFDLGTAAHTLLLGKGRQMRIIEAADYRSAKAQAQRDAFREAGFVPILMDQFARAKDMQAAALEQIEDFPGGKRAFNEDFGLIEMCAAAIDKLGVWTRCLIDFYGYKDPDGIVLWDYKTGAGSANPLCLSTRASEQGWAFQAAFQERIICTLKPELSGKIRFRFLVQENEPPYLCSVIELAGDAMTLARKQVAASIAIWKRCFVSNEWPAYPRKSVPIGVPSWAEAAWLARELDDELVALGANDPYLMGVDHQIELNRALDRLAVKSVPVATDAGNAPAAATHPPRSSPAAGAIQTEAAARKLAPEAAAEAALARGDEPQMNSPRQPPKKPGRPRLSAEQKAANKAARATALANIIAAAPPSDADDDLPLPLDPG